MVWRLCRQALWDPRLCKGQETVWAQGSGVGAGLSVGEGGGIGPEAARAPGREQAGRGVEGLHGGRPRQEGGRVEEWDLLQQRRRGSVVTASPRPGLTFLKDVSPPRAHP